jgi:hypothetical protein
MSPAPYTEAWLEGPSKTRFYTRTYAPEEFQPARAVIVFIHGFAEHVGRYTHFHPLFARKGFAVFAIDQRGFGLTGQDEEKRSKGSAYGKTSWKEQMADIAWAIVHAKEAFKGVPVILMGHSMVSSSLTLCVIFAQILPTGCYREAERSLDSPPRMRSHLTSLMYRLSLALWPPALLFDRPNQLQRFSSG